MDFNLFITGEDLDGGILNSYILEADEALVLSAIDHFDDDSAKSEFFQQSFFHMQYCIKEKGNFPK